MDKEKRKKKWIINYSMLGTCSATTTCAVNRDGKGPNVLLVLINTSYSRKKKSILINITSKWKSTLKQSSAQCYDYIEIQLMFD